MVLPFSCPVLEYCIIRLTSPRNVQIVTLYKSPSCDNDRFRNKMSTELLPHLDMAVPLLIIGDFNFDLFQDQGWFLAFMEDSFHCQQHVNQPTATAGSLLDLVFTNADLISCDAIYCSWSDHKTISVVVL